MLNDNEVKYLIIGGYAVAYHGNPRYTKDLDIWIKPDKPNANQLLKALIQFGFGTLELTVEDFTQPDITVQLGYPPNRIDLLTSANGLEFGDCYPDREKLLIDNLEISIVDLDSLRKNKRATGRHQDLADLEGLQ